MTKKAKTLLISLAALLLLGGGYYGASLWQRSQIVIPEIAPYEPPIRLGNLEFDTIVKIENPFITIEIVDDLWEVTSLEGVNPPSRIELNQMNVMHLILSLASIWVESVLEEDPEDISIFGLDDPSAWARITDLDGKVVEYIRGDLTPSRTSFYAMEGGDPRVFLINSFLGENFLFDLDRVRLRINFPRIDFETLAYLRIEPSARPAIEINIRPPMVPVHMTTSLSSFVMNSPYSLLRGVDSEGLNEIMESIISINVDEFIEDNPSSLVPYGLDRPTRITVRSIHEDEEALDILVGDLRQGSRFAMLPGGNMVFTVSGIEPVLRYTPFSLLDKFAFIINIDLVDRIIVTGGRSPITAELQGQRDNEIFTLNGRRVEDRSFRQWYQTVIGLLFDAEYSGQVQPQDTGEGNITIEYELNMFSGARSSITLIPYNRDFYILSQEGTMEFLISRNQVNRIWESLNRVTYID